MSATFAERAVVIRRAASLFCLRLGWSPVHEVSLPNARRADILALTTGGDFACIEIKSGLRDFQVDTKWPEYRDYSDSLYFAVDEDFPLNVLPADTGLIVVCGREAEMLREAPMHRIAASRRRALLYRFAVLAAQRLAMRDDPDGVAGLGSALLIE